MHHVEFLKDRRCDISWNLRRDFAHNLQLKADMPFEFKRLQFSVHLAFAITNNKAWGQSLGICGLNLEYQVFSHGQLYVACSRVGTPSVLYIYTENGKTKNVVYHSALQ